MSDTAAGSLRHVLRARGSADQVASLSDCLAFGPIKAGNWLDRAKWLKEKVPDPHGWEMVAQSAPRLLEQVCGWSEERLVWIAPQSACEQCGLQWYLEQLPAAPAAPMIIVDGPLRGGWRDAPPLGLGELPLELLADLLDNAQRREWPKERSSPDLWRRLRADNALLRVVEDGVLRSVAEDYFDENLLKQCTDEWQSWSSVVGSAMVETMEQGHNNSDGFYIWRLNELVRTGRIACEGDLPGSHPNRRSRSGAVLRRSH